MVTTGLRALKAFAKFQPQAVLLDIGLPGMDGYEVARHLRSQATAEPPLLVALTGYGQPEDIRHSMEAGFDHHFVKPADLTALTAVFAAVTPRHEEDASSKILTIPLA